MEKMLDLISKEMKQKKDAKTVVFAIKMFWYWARVAFGKVITYPYKINIPIDSRLTNIYEKIWKDNLKIEDFYKKLSKEKNIPPLHLDSVLWVNYNYLMWK
jgi:DNA-(apurinic or apyrimidinic site) lyase